MTKKPALKRLKTSALNLLVCLLALLAFFTAAEIFFIWKYERAQNVSRRTAHPALLEPDPQLKWRPKSFVHLEYEEESGNGSFYPVHYETFQGGFRQWGRLDSGKKKMFVIGDSFTQAHQVSNDKTYYFHLGQALGMEIFAFGGDAYNSVQECMVLREYLPRIKPKPDIILWQFSENDILNNDWRIPFKISFAHNFGSEQPFLENGRIVYHSQEKILIWLIKMRDHVPSHFINFVTSRILSLLMGEPIKGQPWKKPTPAEWALAAKSTEAVFHQVRETAGDIPVYLFTSSDTPELRNLLKKIAADNHFIFIETVPDALKQSVKNGEVVTAKDQGHWNERGHAIVAEVLKKQAGAQFIAPQGRDKSRPYG